MSEPTTNPRVPRSLVEGILGEQAARSYSKSQEIAQRSAVLEARHERIRQTANTILTVSFSLACAFGIVMGCLAIWDAVVG